MRPTMPLKRRRRTGPGHRLWTRERLLAHDLVTLKVLDRPYASVRLSLLANTDSGAARATCCARREPS